ncbi:MAG: SDR family oxidoreductase [Gammaproteobacteria bacterium]|nr:SDR family oxidoreductase [Gammaproteobacteria bacterium]MDH3446984.1 SDR family oxidoreductase [Gammaproteobacteria bacterium]
MGKFENRKAIVLGGTSGIGLATAEMLRDGGAEVIAGSRHECAIDGIDCVQIDVLDRAALGALFAKHSGFDYLVNAATGGPRAIGPFLEMDLDGFQNSFAKLWGYVNSVRLGVPQMSPDGAVVLFSGYPARKYRPGTLAIGSVGGSVEAFIHLVANEISPVRINGVCPGLIDTPMSTLEGDARREYYEKGTRGHLIPRPGTAEECAAGAIFLLENEFVTGTIIDIDGGAIVT